MTGWRPGLALVCGVWLAHPAGAAQEAASAMSVAVTVSRSCEVEVSPLAFGAYDPVDRNAAAPLDTETIMIVTCTKGTPANIALGSGGNASGSLRYMANGANLLNYEIYQDAARLVRWGDATGDQVVLGPSTGDPQSVHIYARVPAKQDVPIGVYSDAVVATVYF